MPPPPSILHFLFSSSSTSELWVRSRYLGMFSNSSVHQSHRSRSDLDNSTQSQRRNRFGKQSAPWRSLRFRFRTKDKATNTHRKNLTLWRKVQRYNGEPFSDSPQCTQSSLHLGLAFHRPSRQGLNMTGKTLPSPISHLPCPISVLLVQYKARR